MRELLILFSFVTTFALGIKKNTEVKEVVQKEDVVTEVEETLVFSGESNVKRYVLRFQNLAISEMESYGIPASITIAQGILESDSGQSDLAVRGNNHFGIKCKRRGCKHKNCINKCDDSCRDYFVTYDTAWESYRHHSLLLSNPNFRYISLQSCTDYKCWANGLQNKGYATSKTYAKKLIRLIEKYNLYHLDNAKVFS
jgi:flagellum-specific peptidoglycan hydrolase FlgJ